mmetsp:Transcript_13246/g.17330  ORF Transcript_13246/g.17330 Transcript_13246/m.17330 type:complete len:277 (-) Transcript_13246:299-1129(-)
MKQREHGSFPQLTPCFVLAVMVLALSAVPVSGYSLGINPEHFMKKNHESLLQTSTRKSLSSSSQLHVDVVLNATLASFARPRPPLKPSTFNSYERLRDSDYETFKQTLGDLKQQPRESSIVTLDETVASTKGVGFLQSLGAKTRDRIQKMGIFPVVTYYLVSQINSATTMAIAWYMFSMNTGLSPLAPGQWKGYFGIYAGFFFFNSCMRPLRLALCLTYGSKVESIALWAQQHFQWNKTKSVVVTAAVLYSFTLVYTAVCFLTASALSGVPILPMS